MTIGNAKIIDENRLLILTDGGVAANILGVLSSVRSFSPAVIVVHPELAGKESLVKPETLRALRSPRTGREGGTQGRTTARFIAVFWTVAMLTIMCLLAFIVVSWLPSDPTEMQRNVLSLTRWGWIAGLGAIIGLLGGKAL
jgi:hypothetical protein